MILSRPPDSRRLGGQPRPASNVPYDCGFAGAWSINEGTRAHPLDTRLRGGRVRGDNGQELRESDNR